MLLYYVIVYHSILYYTGWPRGRQDGAEGPQGVLLQGRGRAGPQLIFIHIHQLFTIFGSEDGRTFSQSSISESKMQYTCFELDTEHICWWIRTNFCRVAGRRQRHHRPPRGRPI